MQGMYGTSGQMPGEETSTKKHLLGTASSILQRFAPLSNICEHVCGVHFYSGEITRSLVSHHFCSVLNEDVRQCLVYDSNEKKARLIGVEYIISEKLYKTLSDEEARYWHSHVYEVKSGILNCPGVPLKAEHEVMKELIRTYGKTIHLWQVDRGDTLPMGPPQLMMSYTQDSQVNWKDVETSDQITGSTWKERKENRMDIPTPTTEPRSDGWTKTNVGVNFDVVERPMKK
jgi:hypothetical protein